MFLRLLHLKVEAVKSEVCEQAKLLPGVASLTPAERSRRFSEPLLACLSAAAQFVAFSREIHLKATTTTTTTGVGCGRPNHPCPGATLAEKSGAAVSGNGQAEGVVSLTAVPLPLFAEVLGEVRCAV